MNSYENIKQLDKLTKTLLIVFLILAIITSVVAYQFVSEFTAGMTILDLPGAPIFGALTGNKENEGSGLSNDTPVSTPEPWDGNSRVTLLILGLDYNDWRGGETPHSDTMILLSLDPITKTASMLSLPRDLWVNIPDFGYGRINEAYFNGAAYNLPGGGAELARQTVEQFIGVPVDIYAVIYFDAFVSFIDEIGGVVVQPDQPVKIEKFGGGQEETLEAGVMYTLDGGLALAYARARYTKDGDVDRARRQQEVILAIKNRILKYENLPALIAKAPKLYQELSSGISTNLKSPGSASAWHPRHQPRYKQYQKRSHRFQYGHPNHIARRAKRSSRPIPDKIRALVMSFSLPAELALRLRSHQIIQPLSVMKPQQS